jgi:hypothetical protein
MAQSSVQCRTETEDLARARELVEFVMARWDVTPWTGLLADDVLLLLRLGSVVPRDFGGGMGVLALDTEVTGQHRAAGLLRQFYPELMRLLSITAKLVSGYDAVLAGTVVLPSTGENTDDQCFAMAVCMRFGSDGRVHRLALVPVDLDALGETIRDAIPGCV